VSGGGHPDGAFFQGSCCPGGGLQRLHPASWVKEGGRSTCARCALVESLEELQEEISRLCCIREGEQQIKYYLRLCKKTY